MGDNTMGDNAMSNNAMGDSAMRDNANPKVCAAFDLILFIDPNI